MDVPEQFGGINRFLVVQLEAGQSATPDLRARGRSLKLNVATKVKGADAYVFCKAGVDQHTARRLFDAHMGFRRGDLDSPLDIGPGGVPNHYIVCHQSWRSRYPGEPIPNADPSIPALITDEDPGSTVHPFHVIVAMPVEDPAGVDERGRRMISPDAAIEGRYAAKAAESGLNVLTPVPSTGTPMQAVIATRAPIAPDEAQRLWDMHVEFLAENGGDGTFHHTYELTDEDHIDYTEPDPGVPELELAPLPVGSRFAFVPADASEDDPRHQSARDVGLTFCRDVVIVHPLEDDLDDCDVDLLRELEPRAAVGEELDPTEIDPIDMAVRTEVLGKIYTEFPVLGIAVEKLHRLFQAHDGNPMSVLERVEEDGVVDHFVVHDTMWVQRVQADRAERLRRAVRNVPEGNAISTNERPKRSGTMTSKVKPSKRDSLLAAAAFEALTDHVSRCSAVLDARAAAIWGDTQPHVAPDGSPAIGLMARMAEAIVDAQCPEPLEWSIERDGETTKMTPMFGPTGCSPETLEALMSLAGPCQADQDGRSLSWPRSVLDG